MQMIDYNVPGGEKASNLTLPITCVGLLNNIANALSSLKFGNIQSKSCWFYPSKHGTPILKYLILLRFQAKYGVTF
jgi:hypothetical protein